MGATKIYQYSDHSIHLAKLANALGHPARITIVQTLREIPSVRNTEFQKLLDLSQTTVHNHLLKLKSANIIEFHYSPHEYQINLIHENLEDLSYFIQE